MTRKPVVPRALARIDVDKAVDHYAREAGEAAALGFVEALERAYDHLARHPASGSPRLGYELDLPGLRVWPLRRFPWLIFYREDPDRIDVWRVLHAGRDLPAWLTPPDGA